MSLPQLIMWDERIKLTATAAYPIEGDCFRTMEYVQHAVPVPPNPPNGSSAEEKATLAHERSLYANKVRTYDERIYKQQEAKSFLFNMVYSTLSEDSKDLLIRQPEHNDVTASRSAIALYSLIKRTHGKGTASSNSVSSYTAAANAWAHIAIEPNETIAAYTLRVEETMKIYQQETRIVVTDNEHAWCYRIRYYTVREIMNNREKCLL